MGLQSCAPTHLGTSYLLSIQFVKYIFTKKLLRLPERELVARTLPLFDLPDLTVHSHIASPSSLNLPPLPISTL